MAKTCQRGTICGLFGNKSKEKGERKRGPFVMYVMFAFQHFVGSPASWEVAIQELPADGENKVFCLPFLPRAQLFALLNLFLLINEAFSIMERQN